MRVLLFVTDLQPGGTPLRVVRWAGWLPRIGIEPIVGCLAPRGPLSDRLDAMGVTNFACNARGPRDLAALWRLFAALRRFNPDILHAFLFHANIAARLVGRLDRRRPIVTSTATIEIERRWHLVLERFTADLSDLHVVNAPAVKRHVVDDLGFPADRVVVIPNGVDVEAIDAATLIDRATLSMPPDVPLIVWAGRMDPIKRLDLWVEIFDRVRQTLPLCGVLIGDGPERPRIEADLWRRGLLAEQNLALNRVRMIGWSNRPAEWLKAADIALLTSDTEGSPNALLEAMACECAVVASSVGGVVDTVENDRTGMLCAAGNVDKFVDKVVELCRNTSLRKSLGHAARISVLDSQGRDAILAALRAFYGSLNDCGL